MALIFCKISVWFPKNRSLVQPRSMWVSPCVSGYLPVLTFLFTLLEDYKLFRDISNESDSVLKLVWKWKPPILCKHVDK